MTKERQLKKQEEIRNSILDAARDIIARDGVAGLSIRKITNAIEYSPAIVYHYFKDKNEIVESLVGEGYRKILSSIGQVSKNEKEPEREIKELFVKYIKAALNSPEEYRAFMLNDDPSVRQTTAILERGIAEGSPTMKQLKDTVQRGILLGLFEDYDAELAAQVIWTSTFGLIIKLMIEKEIPEEQAEQLIEQHFQVMFNGIMKR
jgi:AcrR family transcriptional regulator